MEQKRLASFMRMPGDGRCRSDRLTAVAAMKCDITELRASEARARLMFENDAQAIVSTDMEGRIVDANAVVRRLFGYSSAELIGAHVEMLIPESSRKRHSELRANYDRQPHTRPAGIGMDLMARRKDGSQFSVEVSLSHFPELGGLTVAFISDITLRRKAAEEREVLISTLTGALAEKTVLLKEINHRVKNNLSVIGALLGMQAETIHDKEAQIAFAETQQRVQSMALIHEYLYADEHLDRVNFGQYVRQLAGQIRDSCAIMPDRVHLDIEVEEINLSVHRAIPCGLILNELLTNAFKHAFLHGRTGTVVVHLLRTDESRLLLSCQDDGPGIPDNFDWQNTASLGLRIVRILAKQIDGTLTLVRGTAGARFELHFPARDS